MVQVIDEKTTHHETTIYLQWLCFSQQWCCLGIPEPSSVDWCKVHERLAIRFQETVLRNSNKTNNIHDKKWSFQLRLYLVNMSKSTVLCS